MTREQYITHRQTATYPPDVFYDYYIEHKEEDTWMAFEEFQRLFPVYIMQFAGDTMPILNKIVRYYDSKFHVHILMDQFNQILKIY